MKWFWLPTYFTVWMNGMMYVVRAIRRACEWSNHLTVPFCCLPRFLYFTFSPIASPFHRLFPFNMKMRSFTISFQRVFRGWQMLWICNHSTRFDIEVARCKKPTVFNSKTRNYMMTIVIGDGLVEMWSKNEGRRNDRIKVGVRWQIKKQPLQHW